MWERSERIPRARMRYNEIDKGGDDLVRCGGDQLYLNDWLSNFMQVAVIQLFKSLFVNK